VCRGCVREYSPNGGIAFRTSSAIRALVSKRLPHLVLVPPSGLSQNLARSVVGSVEDREDVQWVIVGSFPSR
jgi:hypothetical protein